MATWLQRVGAMLSGRTAEPVVAVPKSPPAPVAPRVPDALARPAVPPAPESVLDLQPRFLAWLFGGRLDDALQDGERRLLDQLDALIASKESLAALLPRTPAVIPQLMNSLRDESQSTDALAQRVARDPHLVIEVIRMANSAQAKGNAPVTDIAEAIRRLGLGGLHRAILRVVLKPMFDGQGDSLTARCTQRLWQHSEAKAEACLQEARARGMDPFEGYLAGLMHNVGWTAALRALDRIEPHAPARLSLPFAAAVEAQRDPLFAALATSWQLTDGLSALASELHQQGLVQAQSALGNALRSAHQPATLAMLGAAPAAA
jgi:HD-like signal output (HDOD) protein